MKELTIEEKAKAYDEALAKAKEQYNYPCMRSCMGILEEIFPELAESEDEKIRKELISFFSDLPDTDTFRGIPPSKVIAWLEKQKEYESTDFEYVWDRTDCGELTAALDKYSEEAIINMCHAWYDKGIELERKSWLEKQGQVKESTISQHEIETCKENNNSLTSEDENVRKALLELVHDTTGDELWIDYNVHKEEALDWLERQGEHANFRNKIQVGDKVTRNENGVLVNLSQLKRVAKPSEKQAEQKPADKVEPKFKVGDKIYLKPEYRMPNDDTPIANTVKEIRRIDDKHYRFDGSYIFIEDQDKYELVEQKTEENKGNLGGISSNSAWSEENEPQKELAESYLDKFDKKFPILPTLKGKRLADYKNFLNKCQQIFGLKYWGIHPTQAKLFEKLSLLWAAWGAEHLQGLGQTYGDMDDEILWSEEDEENMKKILDAIGSYYYLTTDDDILCNWLKSIKDRVQPKQEWSEEDEEILRTILSDGIRGAELDMLQVNWLKSLRPLKRWEPSDEQISLLQAIINEPNNAASESCQIVLKDILEQLKKLKEGKG